MGVHIDPLLKFEKHYEETIKKTKSLSYLVMRSISYKTRDIMIPIYKAIIRPVLEYGNVVWSPYKRKDIDAIENVQHHYTKSIIDMKDLDYEDRLSALGLPSLEYRRIRGDMIETYKYVHKYYDASYAAKPYTFAYIAYVCEQCIQSIRQYCIICITPCVHGLHI